MCLNNKKEDVLDFLEKNKNKKKIKVYKVIKINYDYTLESIIYDYEWKPGEHKSTSRSKKPCLQDKDIDHGFHVYLTKNKAEWNRIPSYQTVLVELTVYLDDLIGVNYYVGEAAFRKVYVTKKAIKEAVEGYKNRVKSMSGYSVFCTTSATV